MSSKELTKNAILQAMEKFAQEGTYQVSSSQLKHVKASPATIRRYLDLLVGEGKLKRTGKARATRYQLTNIHVTINNTLNVSDQVQAELNFSKSPQSKVLITKLERPLGTRTPVTYQRSFVDKYVPNQSWLLPQSLAELLYEEGRMQGQQPAGTYARKVLEQLLIDLSWSSSRLEGNRHTLLETEELFKKGLEGGDEDAVMLLNHKRGIEFLVDAVPEYGLITPLIRNLHSLLMQDLLSDPEGLGQIRKKIVNISDTVYVPSQVPSLLEEMINGIIERAREIKNPIEAAFYLWVNIAYLQPFEDGNKRTSRLSANIPLMLYNCAPLSFFDVDKQDYAQAVMGVYEHQDTSLAADLFAWAYRRSIQKYAVLLESVGAPDPFRLKHREALCTAIQSIVRDGASIESVVADANIQGKDANTFEALLRSELSTLGIHNCARFRLTVLIRV